ncbi:MAG: phage major capsid protein [Anaerolineae bacterium]|nr:phage major capsid protein [Anaerolineae bacterium]
MDMQEKLKGLLTQARDIAAKAEDEGRDFTADERQKVANLMEEAKGVKEKIKQAAADADLRKQIDAWSEEFKGASQGREDPGKPGVLGSLGQQFVESPAFKAWMSQVAPNGRIPDGARGLISPPVEFKTLLGRKDLVTGESDTSAGAFVQTDYTGIYEPLGRYPVNVLGLVNRRQTGSDLVEFVRQTSVVQQATPVAEANVTDSDSTTTGAVAGTKPEGATAFEKVQEAVKTIAVWIPATKRALSDAAQIRGIIDQELRDDLNEELEDQIINGDGVGENFTGILNTAGILLQAWTVDALTTIRAARASLQVNGHAYPTALVLHPYDAAALDLLTDDTGRYYFGGPVNGQAGTVWRVPVVESESIAQGQGLMGDFRKAVIFDREQANIQVSDSHADFFIRNMVAILAEMRAAFGVIRPTAFITLDVESGS